MSNPYLDLWQALESQREVTRVLISQHAEKMNRDTYQALLGHVLMQNRLMQDLVDQIGGDLAAIHKDGYSATAWRLDPSESILEHGMA